MTFHGIVQWKLTLFRYAENEFIPKGMHCIIGLELYDFAGNG